MKKILRRAWKERRDADQQEIVRVGMAYGCLLSQKLKECRAWKVPASLLQAVVAALDSCVDTRSNEISVFRGITPTTDDKVLAHLCVLRRKCKAMKEIQSEMKQQLLHDLSSNHRGEFTAETGSLEECSEMSMSSMTTEEIEELTKNALDACLADFICAENLAAKMEWLLTRAFDKTCLPSLKVHKIPILAKRTFVCVSGMLLQDGVEGGNGLSALLGAICRYPGRSSGKGDGCRSECDCSVSFLCCRGLSIVS